MDNEEKMYRIASHLNDLNEEGRVKGFKAHEKGYARILDVIRGCSVFIHHLKDGGLSIGLFVTPKARERQAIICNQSIEIFRNLFNKEVEEGPWFLLDRPTNATGYYRYYVDVSNRTLEDLVCLFDKIKDEYKEKQ